MTEDFTKIGHGLYRVHWKSGGSSLAAVGYLDDGTRWIAPTNWTTSKGENPTGLLTKEFISDEIESIKELENLTELDRYVFKNKCDRRVEVFEWVYQEGAPSEKQSLGEAWFRSWGVDCEAYDGDGTGTFSTAIVEFADGTVKNVPAENVKFIK